MSSGIDDGIVVTFDFGNSGARVYTGLGRWNSDHTEFLLDEGPQLVSGWPSCAPDLTSTPVALTFKDHEPKAWGQSAFQYIHKQPYHVEPHPKKKFAELAREKPDKGLGDIMVGMKYLWEHVLRHVLEHAANYYGLSERPAIRQVGIGVPSGWHARVVQLFLETAPDFGCPIMVRTETSAILQSYLHEVKPKVGHVYVIADHGSSTQNFGLSEVAQVDPLITRELASGGSTIGACTLEDILRERVVDHVGAAASLFSEENDQIIDRFLAFEFERLKFLADNDDLVEQPINVKPEPFIVTKNFMDEIREELFTQMNEPWTEFLSQCQKTVAETGKKIELVVVSGGISGSKGLQKFLKNTHPGIPLVFPNRIKTEDVARGLMYLAIRPFSCSRDTVGRYYGIGSDEKYKLGFHKEEDKLKKRGDLGVSADEETYNSPKGGQPLAKTVRWIIFPESKTTGTFSFPMSLEYGEDVKEIWVDVFTRPPNFSGDKSAVKSPRSEAEKVNTYALNFERELQEVANRRKEEDKPCDNLPYYVLLQPEGEDIKVSVVWDLNGTNMDLEELLSSDSKCVKSCKVHRAICADEICADEASKRKRGPENMESSKRLKTSEAVDDDATGDPGSGQSPAGASARNTIELSSAQPEPTTPPPGPEDMESNKPLKPSEAGADGATGDPGSGQFPAGASARNSSELSPPRTTHSASPSPPTSQPTRTVVDREILKSSTSNLPSIVLQRTPLSNTPGLIKSKAKLSTTASRIIGENKYRRSPGTRKLCKATRPPLHQQSSPPNVSVFEGLNSWTSKTPITLEFSKNFLQAIHSKTKRVYRQIGWRETKSIWRLPAQSNPDSHVYFIFSSDCSNSFVITNHSTGTKPREIPDANDSDWRTELDLMFDMYLTCHHKHVLIPRNEPLYVKARNGPTEGFLIFLQHPGIHNDTLERNVMLWGLQSPLYLPAVALRYNMGLEPKLDGCIDLHISVGEEEHRFTDLRCDKNELEKVRSHLGIHETCTASRRPSIHFAAAARKAKTMEQEADKVMEKAKEKKGRSSIGKRRQHPIMAGKIKNGAKITLDNEVFQDESTNVASSRGEFVGRSMELLAGDFGSEDDSEDDGFDPADYSDCSDD